VNLTGGLDSVIVTMVDGTEVQGQSTGVRVGGTGAGGDMPASISACMSWRISAAYRGGHPRSYLPFIDKSMLDPGPSVNKISAGSATALAVAADSFLSAADLLTIGGVQTGLGTVSYVRAKAPRVLPVFFIYLPGTRVNTRLASQRRRLGKLSTGVYES
jgi:hypothetical protein